jgi:tellurite resistance protein
MKPIHIDIGEFEPEKYLQALVALAHIDGMHPDEELFIRQQASAFGVDAEPYFGQSTSDSEFTQIGQSTTPTTRRLIYRDCYMLAEVDGQISQAERALLDRIRQDLALEVNQAQALESWAQRYAQILREGEALLAGR